MKKRLDKKKDFKIKKNLFLCMPRRLILGEKVSSYMNLAPCS